MWWRQIAGSGAECGCWCWVLGAGAWITQCTRMRSAVAILYDGRNVVNLALLEYMCRRKQSFAEAHVLNPSAPSCEAADFMGSEYPGGGMCQHSLQVAQQMARG